MKLLILGISGRTGRLVAEEAIKRGHSVVGITRDASRVSVKDASIVTGTPYDYDTVSKAINGCDAVIGTLSGYDPSQALFGKVKPPFDVMSVSMNNTVKAMQETGIKRIILMTANGVGDSAGQLPGFFSLMIKLTNIKYAYADHAVQEKILENSNLDWTIVRPVGLTDKNENLSILYSIKGEGKIKSMISRNAVAHFMLDCIEKGSFLKQKPGISNA